MTRKRKTIDKPKKFEIALELENIRELLAAISPKKITDLQYWNHLRILDLISKKQAGNGDGYVSLDAAVLKDSNSRYSNCISNLLKLDIIEFKKGTNGGRSYDTNKHLAIKYRYTAGYRFSNLIEVNGAVRVHKTRKAKSITDKRTKRLLQDVSGFPEYGFLLKWLHHITIDIDAVEKECEQWLSKKAYIKDKLFTEEKYRNAIAKAKGLNADQVVFSIKENGRILTAVVQVLKAFRKFIKIKNYHGTIYHSDLISAHVLLAVPLLRKFQTNSEGKQELDKVINMITSKRFYSILSEELRAESVVIDDEKKDFLKHVWNAHDARYDVAASSAYRRVFNKLYPTFNEWIKLQKPGYKGSSEFSSKMTKLETKLFNNNIVKRVLHELGNTTFLAGIYDALIYKEENREAIEKIMEEEVFKATGLTGMVKTITLQEESNKVISYPLIISDKDIIDIPDEAVKVKKSIEEVHYAELSPLQQLLTDEEWDMEDAMHRIWMTRGKEFEQNYTHLTKDQFDDFMSKLIDIDFMMWCHTHLRERLVKTYHTKKHIQVMAA